MGGKIPLSHKEGDGCAPQCATGVVTGSDPVASCANYVSYESALGFWKGMCGECAAVIHGRRSFGSLLADNDMFVCVCGWRLQSAPQKRP